ncbi:MAG: hypothetical protein MR750_08890 [Methanobrevibacter boviskoreani]|uniref:hypothetical protein n=1 Tax=Methanobrevibacter boviskoreani TaxID=1348249 RepID=UPI0005951D0E|nr:hypothetical protein [Methanobrevibacter boviskoreani]MCI6931351.1 hypothetical protein [Methanobrevibacter boviskoreani]
MKIYGFYKIQNKETGEIYTQSGNIITSLAINFMLNCLIKENNEFIKKINFGTGKTTPTANDVKLENNISSSIIESSRIENNIVTFNTTFTTEDVNGANEIGVFTNQGTLISRDILSDTLNVPSGSYITVTYSYIIGTGSHITNWDTEELFDGTIIYSTPATTFEQLEQTYKGKINDISQVNSKELLTTEGTYYVDTSKNILYVHPYGNEISNIYSINQ